MSFPLHVKSLFSVASFQPMSVKKLIRISNPLLTPSGISSTHSLVYKGWLIRDAFQRLLDLLEILRDEV